MSTNGETVEHARLREAREQGVAWRRWGPYLSERQWGTVREDYSPHGTAWPVYGGTTRFQADPHWRDCLLFYEYFHGDNGAGVGASHQTGWTGLVSVLLSVFGTWTARDVLESMPAAGRRLGPEGALPAR